MEEKKDASPIFNIRKYKQWTLHEDELIKQMVSKSKRKDWNSLVRKLKGNQLSPA